MLKARIIDAGALCRFKKTYFSEVGTPENILKSRTMYDAF